MDINSVVLIGRIGSVFKYAKSQNGNVYSYFSLEIEDKENAKDEMERNFYQIVHVMCFRKKVVEYLQKVGAKSGNRVVVIGYISSYSSELKGKKLISNGVCARDIFVVKTNNN